MESVKLRKSINNNNWVVCFHIAWRPTISSFLRICFWYKTRIHGIYGSLESGPENFRHFSKKSLAWEIPQSGMVDSRPFLVKITRFYTLRVVKKHKSKKQHGEEACFLHSYLDFSLRTTDVLCQIKIYFMLQVSFSCGRK